MRLSDPVPILRITSKVRPTNLDRQDDFYFHLAQWSREKDVAYCGTTASETDRKNDELLVRLVAAYRTLESCLYLPQRHRNMEEELGGYRSAVIDVVVHLTLTHFDSVKLADRAFIRLHRLQEQLVQQYSRDPFHPRALNHPKILGHHLDFGIPYIPTAGPRTPMFNTVTVRIQLLHSSCADLERAIVTLDGCTYGCYACARCIGRSLWLDLDDDEFEESMRHYRLCIRTAHHRLLDHIRVVANMEMRLTKLSRYLDDEIRGITIEQEHPTDF